MKNENKFNHYNLYYIIKESFEKEKNNFNSYYVMLGIIMESIKNGGCDDYGQNNADNSCEGGTERG